MLFNYCYVMINAKSAANNKTFIKYLRQSFSSSPAAQSGRLSHSNTLSMHLPSLQRNSVYWLHSFSEKIQINKLVRNRLVYAGDFFLFVKNGGEHYMAIIKHSFEYRILRCYLNYIQYQNEITPGTTI